MKYKLKTKTVAAVQWKGGSHKINGLENHPTYPQLGYFNDYEVYKGDWIVTDSKGKRTLMTDFDFKKDYEKV